MPGYHEQIDDGLDDIRELIARCSEEGLAAEDVAVLESRAMSLTVPSQWESLMPSAVECPHFILLAWQVAAECHQRWTDDGLKTLTEALLFHGLEDEAGMAARILRDRDPTDSYFIRLWAYAAGDNRSTIERFVVGISNARDREEVIKDAYDFARHNEPNGLVHILDSLLAKQNLQPPIR